MLRNAWTKLQTTLISVRKLNLLSKLIIFWCESTSLVKLKWVWHLMISFCCVYIFFYSNKGDYIFFAYFWSQIIYELLWFFLVRNWVFFLLLPLCFIRLLRKNPPLCFYFFSLQRLDLTVSSCFFVIWQMMNMYWYIAVVLKDEFQLCCPCVGFNWSESNFQWILYVLHKLLVFTTVFSTFLEIPCLESN